MILVVGSVAAGKRTYVETLGYLRKDMSSVLEDDKPVLYDLQDLVANDPANCLSMLDALVQKEVVICNEVGSGVIPVTGNQREAREQTGRLCILLAQRAERVVRLVCGIPTVIKEL